MSVTHTYTGVDGDITIDFTAQEINCESGIGTLEVQELVDACRAAEYSEAGIGFSKICNASGKEYLDTDNGIQVGITIVLLDNWVVYTQKSSGVFRVLGGNLVQVSGGDPFKANPLVTQINILSAASTIVSVSSGSGLSAEEHNRLFAIPTDTLETDERAAVLGAATASEQASQGNKIDAIVNAQSEQLTEERAKGLLLNRENTVVSGKITSYVAGGDVAVDVAYDDDNIPTSETIRE